MLSPDEREEAKERRDAEIEFIQSAYSHEEAYILNGDIIRILQLPVDDNDDDVVKVELRLQMPEGYPIHEDAILNIKGHLKSSPSNPQYIRKAALSAIPQLVEKCQATALEVAECGEAVWSVLSSAEEWIESEWRKDILEEYASPTNTIKSTHIEPDNNNTTLGRRIIYSHHIIANSKRRALKDLASQYKLGGYSKIGWPGVILIEGKESNCQLFTDEIKRWRWQMIQVRGEETKNIPEGEELDSHRQLPLQYEEIGEDGMSLLASKCRESGLEKLYLQCMKINDHRTLDSDEVDVEEESSYAILVHVDHMNDRKRYCKWLKKTCDTQGCTLLIRQCRNNTDNNPNRPTIYVIISGERDCVKSVMKQWRTSNVDVDSKNRPCLEKMMTVIGEGEMKAQTKPSYDENEIDCTFEEFEKLLTSINSDWTLAARRSDDKKSIKRAWIWVHHISNTDRLKQIVIEARQHRLGGYVKGGYPGVVVVEGQSQSVDDFISWIKGNKSRPGGFGRNWGHHVRGEAFVENRELPVQFEELEDDMSKFGSLCKDAGVDKEFREFILQHK